MTPYLTTRIGALHPEQRQAVLDEWNVRCGAGYVRNAIAYLYGLIRKALEGTFRLWAARKRAPDPGSAKVPAETPRSREHSPCPQSTPPTDRPTSREVVQKHIAHIRNILQRPRCVNPGRCSVGAEDGRPEVGRPLSQVIDELARNGVSSTHRSEVPVPAHASSSFAILPSGLPFHKVSSSQKTLGPPWNQSCFPMQKGRIACNHLIGFAFTVQLCSSWTQTWTSILRPSFHASSMRS